MRSKKGQTIMVSILFAFIIFMVGSLFVNFVITDVLSAKTSLSCSNAANISDGTKLTCLIVGGTVPYFIILVLSIAGGIVLDRLLT